MTTLLEGKLRLKVNAEKSAVARPWERTFLGVWLYVAQVDAGACHLNEAYSKRWFDRLGLVSLLDSQRRFQRVR
ncbi:hypothetical protein [Chromobacterium sphagni]|uniref:hypothetical protein n=1 Tax=Chromobacterium sphagni TaxID=1903179 RepID=UPI00195E1718|nr:hypothetical protein [Chromobacterium sphagni]